MTINIADGKHSYDFDYTLPKPPDNFLSRPLWSAGARSRFERRSMLRDFAETFPCFRRMHPTSASPHAPPQIRPSPAKHFCPRPPVSLCSGRLAFTPALVGGDTFRRRASRSPHPPSRHDFATRTISSVGTPAGLPSIPILEVGFLYIAKGVSASCTPRRILRSSLLQTARAFSAPRGLLRCHRSTRAGCDPLNEIVLVAKSWP